MVNPAESASGNAAIPPPAVMLEIAVQRENIARTQLVGQMNQAGIGEVARRVGILSIRYVDSAQSPSRKGISRIP
jgi:hypothetical protein